MGAILIVDGPRLARVFFAARLPGSGGWGAGLAWQGRESGGSAAIASRGESIPGRSHGGAVAHPLCCGCLGLRLSEGGISELCTTFLEWLLWRRFNASAELTARIMCETGSNFRVGWHTVFGGFSARIDKNFILAVGLTTGLSFYGV